MNSDRVISIGVVGLAAIAVRSIIPAILSLPEQYKLVGIASRDKLRAAANAVTLGCKSYDNYEQLLADPSIEAVYIPLPNALHYPFICTALKNGKHVLAEKSLGCTLIEVEKMVELARINNCVLLENFQFRFHSQLTSILQLVQEGAIGDLRSVRVSFGFPPFNNRDNIRYQVELGGGALLDAGAYAMKIAPYFLGKEVKVVHGSMFFDIDRKVDIWGGGALKQCNGPLFCHFSYGFDHHYQCSLELWGSLGKLSTNRIFTAPPKLNPKLVFELKEGIREQLLPADDHFKKMIQHFYNLIKDNRSIYDEYEENILQAKLIHQFKNIAVNPLQ